MGIWNKIPETLFLITADRMRSIHHEINVSISETEGLLIHALRLVIILGRSKNSRLKCPLRTGKSRISKSESELLGQPLTYIYIQSSTHRRLVSTITEEVCSSSNSNKPVSAFLFNVIFNFLCNPVEIVGDENGRVCGMKCIRMELGEPDASGRRRPIEVPDSEFMLDVDTVIMSLGTSPNPLIRSTTPGLETNRKGCLIVNENEMTTREGVFAGGDVAAEVVTYTTNVNVK